MVGFIEPVGTTFQSASALRKITIKTMKTAKPLYSRQALRRPLFISDILSCLNESRLRGRKLTDGILGVNPSPGFRTRLKYRENPRSEPAAGARWAPRPEICYRRIRPALRPRC